MHANQPATGLGPPQIPAFPAFPAFPNPSCCATLDRHLRRYHVGLRLLRYGLQVGSNEQQLCAKKRRKPWRLQNMTLIKPVSWKPKYSGLALRLRPAPWPRGGQRVSRGVPRVQHYVWGVCSLGV